MIQYTPMGKSVTRLYTQYQPEHYAVTWQLDEAGMRFSGSVTVTGKKVGRPSQRLTFHANGIKVTTATVTKHDKKGDTTLELTRINHQKSLHEVRLHADGLVYPGSYTVTMQFEGHITDGMTGIYPCRFKDADGNEKMLLATQFESHHAREAFPCIDEPEAKATFDVTLDIQPEREALSNMPVQATDTSANRQLVTFETSPRMSTYLLAFVCGDIHKAHTTTHSGIEVAVWATSAQPASSFTFALDVSKRSIEFFEQYFGVPYPLPKIDHVALPDFSSGAMENWGLVTYRERLLLDYGDTTSQSTREHIALVIAHETSHQWFGNLVTMRWWDNLWLNESFANMMEYVAVDALFPDWHVWDSFVSAEGLSALRRDAIAGIQAVQTNVRHPDEISTLFDPSIVYAKGGRLLNMLKNYIGEADFRQGLSDYFTKHAYSNTSGEDLWAALSKASGKDIARFMNPWILRPGFPVVTLAGTIHEVTISQKHFLEDTSKANPKMVWPVPLFANKTKVPEVLDESQVKLVDGSNDLLVDPNGYGHYIVDYAIPELQAHVHRQIASKALGNNGRLMALNAQAMLAKAGSKSYTEVLQFLDAYREETAESVWDIISMVLGETRRFIDSKEAIEAPLKQFTADMARTLYEQLGWKPQHNESPHDTKLRATAIGALLYADDEPATNTAMKLYAAWANDSAEPTAELRSLILATPIKLGKRAAFDHLLHIHDTTSNGDLQSDICDALTATRSSKWAAELLARLPDGKLTKPQDVDRWLVYLLRNRYTRETAWQWMVDNWQWLEDTFSNDKSYDYLPRYAATCVTTREYETKYREFFEPKTNQPLLRRNIELGIEEISTRLAWLERDLSEVQKFFNVK